MTHAVGPGPRVEPDEPEAVVPGPVASPIGPILLTSRDHGEYLEMFDLAPNELEGRQVLDCPGGASDFTVRLHARGGYGVGVDPLYVLSPAKMATRIRDELERGTRRLDEAPQLYDRAWMGSPESYLGRRARSAEVFLHDYSDVSHRDGRYVAAALPHLPFRSGAFDLALVGNLLFAYADHFDVSWHRQAVHELLRVSREVRVHPLQETSGRPYRHADHLVELLRTDGVDVDVRPVPYRLHPGVNETLVCRHPAPC